MILNDICQLIIDCEHKTAPIQDSGIPSIRTPNIGRGRLILKDVNKVSEETYRLWTKRAIPETDDLILAREAPIGNVAIIKNDSKVCLGQRTVLIRPNKKKINPDYLLYLLLSPQLQGQIISKATGATVHHLNMKDIRNLVLPSLPTRNIQDKLAKILTSYDDLLENNSTRIETLEQMARLIYDEWFVKFKFPGHESVKMIDSEFGVIPDGWEVKNVKTLLKRLPAGAKYTQKNVSEEGSVPVIDQSEKELLGFHNNNPDHKACPEHPIMIFGDHTCKMKIMVKPFSVGPNTIPFVSTKYSESYIYFLIRNLVHTQEYKRHWNELIVKKVAVPKKELTEEFAKIVTPILEQITALQHKNLNLVKTRDLLLPKLIYGEIDVSELDIVVSKVNT